MKYQKPRCDCGFELVFTSTFTYGNTYRIDKQGKIGRRVIKRSGDDFIESALCCEVCNNVYSYYDDESGRVHRGNLK